MAISSIGSSAVRPERLRASPAMGSPAGVLTT
jgi:hypothetical protein